MKKVIILTTLLIALILFSAFPKTVSAQGTYSCQYDLVSYSCVVGSSSCDLGYEPNETLCWSIFDQDDCNAASGTCTYIGPGTFRCGDPFFSGSCTAAAGYDKCNDGYERYQEYCQQCSEDETDACNNAPFTDCIPEGTSPPDPLPTIPGCTEGETATPINGFQPDECSGNWSEGISTAIGCLSTYPFFFILQFMEMLPKLGGGIALLLMIVGSFFVLTSRGNPEQTKRGKEIFVGALIGLIVMIMSIFLLEFISVDLLDLFPRGT